MDNKDFFHITTIAKPYLYTLFTYQNFYGNFHSAILYEIHRFCVHRYHLYAIQNAVIDVKLKQFSTVSILLGFYIILLPLACGLFLYQKLMGQPLVFPTGEPLKILAVVSAVFFVADFFYVGAYTSGGNVVAITTICILMPVVGGLMKFVWVKEVPTPYHLAGFVLAALAVILIAVGDTRKPIKLAEQAESIPKAP